jgi:hypothetical protein
MPKKRDDFAIHGGPDVADVGDDPPVESGVGGPDKPATVGTVLYAREHRREFLIEAMLHPESERFVDDPADPFVFGIAKTEFQFKRALCDYGYPNVKKLSRDDMQRLMAEELRGATDA